MRIEINPRSLLNLQYICEVLYKLHPSVLNDLVKNKRFLCNIDDDDDDEQYLKKLEEIEKLNEVMGINKIKEIINNKELKEYKKTMRFRDLKKYIKLDTDEYINMKIYVEVENPVNEKKLKELVETLEKTRDPEEFSLFKNRVDENAYFAEGYNTSMNDEQQKKWLDFIDGKDVKGLEKLLREKKLYFKKYF